MTRADTSAMWFLNAEWPGWRAAEPAAAVGRARRGPGALLSLLPETAALDQAEKPLKTPV